MYFTKQEDFLSISLQIPRREKVNFKDPLSLFYYRYLNGENNFDVLTRVQDFANSIAKDKNLIIFSHQLSSFLLGGVLENMGIYEIAERDTPKNCMRNGDIVLYDWVDKDNKWTKSFD